MQTPLDWTITDIQFPGGGTFCHRPVGLDATHYPCLELETYFPCRTLLDLVGDTPQFSALFSMELLVDDSVLCIPPGFERWID